MNAAISLVNLEDELNALDWTDLARLETVGGALLERLAEPSVLGPLVRRVRSTPQLLAMCERFELFEKLVLYTTQSGAVRVRLHIFGSHFVEAAHNHRNAFVTRILRGRYRHFIYGDAVALETAANGPPAPLFASDVTAGAGYALGPAAVHSTLAEPSTISLVIRGPAVMGSFKIVDLKTGESRTRLGAEAAAAPQEPGEERIGLDRFAEIEAYLEQQRLI